MFCQPLRFNSASNDADRPGKERPKIGLVLSGGGARGAAHVGVIKVLEELQVPVDYVVGTSLGSVVGGLYAKGQTTEQLENILATLEWNRGFVDALPRSKLPFRRKDEEDKFLTNFELGVQGSSITFPSGFIQGHGLYVLLHTLVGGAALESDFSKLPIPYRAIATDLVSSETVFLDSGDLAKTWQASMSIPAIYAPVKIDGRLLVDGGVSNNLAVDAARDMGADIIIAVDISSPLSTRDQINSVPSVLAQTTNILTHNGTDAQIATLTDKDIYLKPDLGNYATADFDQVLEISKVGEGYARDFTAILSRLSLSDSEYAKYRNKKESVKIKQLPKRIGTITLNQNSRLSDDRFWLRSGLREQSEYSTKKIHDAIDSIYSSELFETIDYRLIQDPNKEDTADLVINATRRSWGTDRIQFGLVLEDNFEGENNFSLSAGYTRRQINSLGADIRIIGSVGELPSVVFEYFQPLGLQGHYFTFVEAEHEQFSRNTFTNESEFESFRISRSQLALFAGWQNNTNLEFRAGLVFGGGDIRQRAGLDTTSKSGSFREGTFQLRARYDTVDAKSFPTHGQKLSVSYEQGFGELNSDTDYEALEVDALIVREFGVVRWVAGVEVSESISGSVPVQRQFARGSILSTAGLRADTEVGESAARASLLAYRPLTFSRTQALRNPAFLGATIETGRVSVADGAVGDEDTLLSGSVFVAADTVIGPVLLGIGGKQGTGLTGLLSIGFSF